MCTGAPTAIPSRGWSKKRSVCVPVHRLQYRHEDGVRNAVYVYRCTDCKTVTRMELETQCTCTGALTARPSRGWSKKRSASDTSTSTHHTQYVCVKHSCLRGLSQDVIVALLLSIISQLFVVVVVSHTRGSKGRGEMESRGGSPYHQER